MGWREEARSPRVVVGDESNNVFCATGLSIIYCKKIKRK